MNEFETPPAYDDEHFVCASEEFTARVDACRARFLDDRSCAGVLSVTGKLQGTDVVFTTDLIQTTLTLSESATQTDFEAVELRGPTPYFQISLTLKSIGGVAEGGGADGGVLLPRVLTLDANAGDRPDALTDDRVEASLRLETNADSDDLPGLSDSGTVTVTAQSSTELAGSLTGAFGTTDDAIEGCFAAFPTRTVREVQ